jgi:hypothetical protein
MGVYLNLYPYHRPNWPARGPVIHTEKGGIDLVKAFFEEMRAIAKPIPPRVAMFLKGAPCLRLVRDTESEGDELRQVNGYDEPLEYALAGEIADKIEHYLETYEGTPIEPRIEDSWVKDKLRRVRKLGKNRPVILYWS